MSGTLCVAVLAGVIVAGKAQLYQRPDYGSTPAFNFNPSPSYNPSPAYNPSYGYNQVSRSDYDSNSLDYGNIYADRMASSLTYASPQSRSPASRRDDSNQRLQIAYDAYLRELRTASAYREGRQPYPHDLQPAAQHSDPNSLTPVDRSDSYGYGDDCSDLDTLSMVLGLGALAAFALYYYLQQQAAMAARSASWFPLADIFQRLPEPAALEMMLEEGCRGLDAIESRRDRRKNPQTNGVEGRGIGGDCLHGLIGPAAGFAALAAIVAYALAQAAMAGARSSDAGVDYTALNTAARQMLIALSAPDQCVAHQLCQVTRSANHVSAPTRTPIKLASVALAWYAARLRQGPSPTSEGPYSEYCWSLVDGLRDSCPASPELCRTS